MASEFSAKMAGAWIVACSPYLKEKRIESPCRVIMSLLASEDEYAVHTQCGKRFLVGGDYFRFTKGDEKSQKTALRLAFKRFTVRARGQVFGAGWTLAVATIE